MQRMLDPRTIAVIGASEAEGSVGRTIMDNVMRSAGREVYPVNPRHESVLGLPSSPDVGAVPAEIDLAVVATPAATVPGVVEQCVAAGVRGAIIVSAGFAETGKDGAALEAQIRKTLRGSNTRVIGPNCLGLIRPSVGLNASFLDIQPEPGNIALISQSGALGTGMLDWAIDAHVGFSLFASVGGMLDVDFADLIDFLGEDEQTRSILIYMETIGDARRFTSAARGFARNKPIIVLKPGHFAESARAALSHTGAMAGGDEVYEAAFRRDGIVRVHEVTDLFHAAEVLDASWLPEGPDVAVVTNAGGLGVMAADSIVEHGGRLAQLSEDAMARLDAALPPYWSHSNPIDVLGDAGSDRFSAAVKTCLAESSVNGILVMYTPQGNARPDQMAKQIVKLVKGTDKPVITVLVGGQSVRKGRQIFAEAGIPCYETPEDAVKTYLDMWRYSRNLELLYETPAELSVDVNPPHRHLDAMIRRAAHEGRYVLTEAESKQFLATYGMPVIGQQIARTLEEAVRAADSIGYPVVLKVVSHEVTHKNAVGGVEIGICSAKDLERAHTEMLERVAKRAPGAVIEGVSVQRMIKPIDYELIFGMKKDRQFGSVLVFGAGGVGAEGLADFTVSLPPLNQVLARRMMEETRIFKSMQRAPRGVEPPDFAALDQMLVQLSNIVVDFPEIAEIDVNPVVVSGGNPCAVDARIIIDKSVLDGAPETPHLIIAPYPSHLVAPWKLTEGTEVLLRPIKPEDEDMIAKMLATMTEASLKDRFFNGIPVFTHERLVRFTNIDYERELAIVAELTKGRTKRIIGVGRLIVHTERGRGEFSVIVHDEFQRRGLGRKLADLMIGVAEDKGITLVEGLVSEENAPLLALSAQLGFVVHSTKDGIVRLRLDLA